MKLRIKILSFFVFALVNLGQAQLTSNCLEIESILVDACVPGTNCTNAAAPACNCEGKNEMVLFLVGPNPIALTNLAVTFPNNSFQGICQNATTSALVDTMNQSIQSCGFFMEPIGGILPANKKVLFITSTEMCVNANSFTNLADTLYVIFQCPGNFAGHFANFGVGLRTLIMGTTIPACQDVVTYDRALLVDQNGNNLAADGATVNFAFDGTPTYVNNGCAAPVTQFSVSAGNFNAALCPGATVTLPGNVTGITAFIQWTGGSGSFANPSDPASSYTLGPNDVAGTPLVLSAVSACQDTLSDTLFIPIISPNPIQINPTSPTQTLCVGSTLQLTATGGGGTYLWTGGINNANLNVTQPGTYIVTGSDLCYAYADTVVITGAALPVAAIQASGPLTFCTGGSVTLTASGGDTYLWNNLSPNQQITVTSSGTFIVGATNACGVDTASVVVTVSATQQAIINESGPLQLCPGQSVTLGSNFSTGFTWSNGQLNQSFTTNQPGTYVLTVNNSCGITTDTSVVTMGSLPIAAISTSGPSTFCQGGSVILTGSGGNSYSWSTGSNQNPITVNSTQNIILTATNQCGTDTENLQVTVNPLPNAQIGITGSTNLCQGQSVSLSSNVSSGFTWSGGQNTQTISINQPGTIVLTVTNSCGTASDSVTVSITALPIAVIQASGPLTFCEGNSVSLNGSGATNLTWSTGQGGNPIIVNTTTNVILTATNACGTDTASANVVVNPLPTALITPSGSTSLCEGQTVTLSANTTQGISWTGGSSNQNLNVNQAGTYILTVSNNCGTATDTEIITLTQNPSVTIVPNGPTTFCTGGDVTLTASGQGNIVWSNGSSSASITVNSSDNYFAVASNSCGSDTAFQMVTVNGPTAAFTANPTTGNAPLDVQLTNGSINQNSNNWSFGDGTFSTILSPSHIFNDQGTYIVTLTVSDAFGCSDTASITIIVGDQFTLSFPNIFTPNGDSFNEFFQVNASGIKDFKTVIFNRWGNIIYKLNNPTESWNGKTESGTDASDGTYFVIVNCNTLAGEAKELTGTLTLVRK